jgi:hypothetical protein
MGLAAGIRDEGEAFLFALQKRDAIVDIDAMSPVLFIVEDFNNST